MLAHHGWLVHRGGTARSRCWSRSPSPTPRATASLRAAEVRRPWRRRSWSRCFRASGSTTRWSAPRDIVADEGGLITFAFCRVRPPESATTTTATAARASSTCRPTPATSTARISRRGASSRSRRSRRRASCSTSAASATGRSTTCSPTRPTHEGGAQAIADEAAAGAYDMVVLSRGYFEDEVNEEESTPAGGGRGGRRRSARSSLRGLLARRSAPRARRLPSGSRRSGSRGRRR